MPPFWPTAGSLRSRLRAVVLVEGTSDRRAVEALARRHARDLEIYPDLWAGFGLIRGGPGTAIVGDPETVAARIDEYRSVGFDTFIVSGQPLLEEAYRVADLLLTLLPIERDKQQERNVIAGPFVAAARG